MKSVQTTIQFIDLAVQKARIGTEVEAAIARVLEHGQYIMGPEVKELEQRLAVFSGARHVVTCSSGTDALALVLMAKKVGPGDAVLVPAFTFCATAEVVAWLGATPIFVDCDGDNFNISAEGLEPGFATARRLGLRAVGAIPVDLFGLPADYESVLDCATRHGAWVLADAAQAFGASYKGQRVGSFGAATATSFFPAKPLGCYGDGGAVLTDDAEIAEVMRSLRVHGQGSHKYENIRVGMTARLDTIQAAVLLTKLSIFEDEIERRNRIAARYTAGLAEVCKVPRVPEDRSSVWAQYTIRVNPDIRDRLTEALANQGIPTAVYYPRPLHRQPAYTSYPSADGGLAVSERLSGEVLSLPMHPYLTEADQLRVIEGIRTALARA